MGTKEKAVRKRASGAGRPLRGNRKRVRVSFTLHPDDLAWLKGQAEAKKWSCSEALDHALHLARDFLSPRPKVSLESIKARVRIPIPLPEIRSICRKYHVRKLSLFGSVLTDRFSPESDIDFLVEFEPSESIGLLERAKMQIEMSELFPGRNIDLRVPRELSRYFRDQVLQEAELIYDAQNRQI